MVQNISRQYTDLDLDFIAHPITGDISRKIGNDAISRSIRNLVLTNYYDVAFRPNLGSGATKLLFDNINPMTANFLRDQIINVIQNYEPRVSLNEVVVSSQEDENGYSARINFTPINSNKPAVATIILERIRG